MSRSLQASVLIVEDEEALSAVIKYNLKKANFIVTSVEDGLQAIEIAKSNRPDVIILDWMLPGMSGIDVCKTLRETEETTNIPIIMLSAKGEEMDRITGLEYGADDYITKPFSPEELVARIKAILRRLRPAFSGKKLNFEDIHMDLDTHTVTRNKHTIKLSPIEYKILQSLMEKPGRVLSRDSLMDKIWGNDVYVGVRTVDVHMTRLRRLLVDASKDGKDVIKTIRLSGYTLKLSKEDK
ncbi:MAG: phosphate regulon transcriptional regulator PhoB [Rickettsiales bacterium]